MYRRIRVPRCRGKIFAAGFNRFKLTPFRVFRLSTTVFAFVLSFDAFEFFVVKVADFVPVVAMFGMHADDDRGDI